MSSAVGCSPLVDACFDYSLGHRLRNDICRPKATRDNGPLLCLELLRNFHSQNYKNGQSKLSRSCNSASRSKHFSDVLVYEDHLGMPSFITQNASHSHPSPSQPPQVVQGFSRIRRTSIAFTSSGTARTPPSADPSPRAWPRTCRISDWQLVMGYRRRRHTRGAAYLGLPRNNCPKQCWQSKVC
jgi:hypothetical protein